MIMLNYKRILVPYDGSEYACLLYTSDAADEL